jgi:signal peptide peptidase SppA
LGQKNYQHIARAVFGTPWFIREAEGSVITSIVRGRLNGESLALDEITARVQAARAQQGPRAASATAGPVAIVPVYGILAPRVNLMSDMSGGTTLDQIREQMSEAIADQSIAAVIMEFDSPGGSVEGVDELATWIRQQRGQKPMVAVVNTMCCSAAYYLAAQCDEIVASQSSITGSIGIFTEQVEYSKANEMDGRTVSIIRAPDAKHDVNDSEPMTDAGRAHLQMLIDDYYGQFVTAVAKGRGVAPQAVRDGYGGGRELTAVRAKAAGLVDRVDTLDATVRRLATGRGRAAMAQPSAMFALAAASSDICPDCNHLAGCECTTCSCDNAMHSDASASALVSGQAFGDRLALVSVQARALVDHAQKRVDMRVKDGRSLTASDRSGLLAVADALHEVADLTRPEAEASEPTDWRAKARVALAIAQAELDFDLTGETSG